MASVDPGLRIGVNLFEAQFRNGQLPGVVKEIVQDTGLPPETLELEIVASVGNPAWINRPGAGA